MEVTGWKALLMGSPSARGWDADTANSPVVRQSQPSPATSLHGGERAFLTLPSDMRQGGDAPSVFSFFLGTSEHVKSLKSMPPTLHSALPAPTPNHAPSGSRLGCHEWRGAWGQQPMAVGLLSLCY